MHRRTFRAIAIALTFAVGAFGVAACGSSDSGGGRQRLGSSSSRPSSTQGKKIKVGLVTDIGGLNDRSFNQLANQGLQNARQAARRRRAAC